MNLKSIMIVSESVLNKIFLTDLNIIGFNFSQMFKWVLNMFLKYCINLSSFTLIFFTNKYNDIKMKKTQLCD